MISFVGFKWVWQGQLCYPLVEGAQYGVSVLSININTPEFYGGAPADLAAATVSPFLPPARLQQMAVTLNSVTLGWDGGLRWLAWGPGLVEGQLEAEFS